MAALARTDDGVPGNRGAAVGATPHPSQDGPGRPRGPLDPRLVRRARATRWFLAAMVAVGGATALLALGQAWFLAHAIASVFYDRTPTAVAAAVPALLAIFAGRALLAGLNNVLAQRAAASVKSQLRVDIMRARLARPLDRATSAAGLVTLVTQGLDALDGFYSKYLPQLVLAVVVPVIIGVAILTADLTSALIVALTLPLIPVFMALVGWSTEARTKRRWDLQTRLARHFADLVAGLPTLQVFGRARAQAQGLAKTEAAHRGETMATLRISFLSALVLELLATLSVAVVAVTVGFRVAFGDLDLATALFVLILAPEAYLPVRQVGVHYHDSADGMAAAGEAFAVIDGAAASGGGSAAAVGDAPLGTVAARPPRTPVRPAGSVTSSEGSGGDEGLRSVPSRGVPDRFTAPSVRPTEHTADNDRGDARGGAFVRPGEPLVMVSGLSHTYAGASGPAVSDVSFDVAPGEFVVLTGPSGGGKTTVLNALVGFLRPTAGTVSAPGRARIAYVGQDPGMLSGTIADNVRLGCPDAPDALVADALARAGGADLDPARSVGDEGEGLSAGERRRVATARALLRIDPGGADLLLLDEPTAGLDADAEATLLGGLRALGVTAVVVSHRAAVLAAADRVVHIGDAS